MRIILSVLLISLFLPMTSHASNSLYSFSDCKEHICQEKFDTYERLAMQGFPDAQMILAGMYYTGYGVERDVKRSLHYYKRASIGKGKYGRDGQPFAQYRAGLLYLYSNEIEQNIPKGLNLLRKAAKGGSIGAAQRLADIYIQGTMVPENFAIAEKWLLMASNGNDKVSQHRLGLLYESGVLGEKNLAKAVTFYQKAAPKNKTAKERLVSLGVIQKSIFTENSDEDIEHITINAPDLLEVLDLSIHNMKSLNAMNKFALEDIYNYYGL